MNARTNYVYLSPGNPAADYDENAMAPDLLREIAQDVACRDFGAIVEWLQCDHGERQACDYFGPVSTAEIVVLMLSGKGTPEQLAACCALLRLRFIAENKDLIDDKQKEIEHG